MLIKSFDKNIIKSEEARELKWMAYKELKDEKLIPIVRKLVEKLHSMELI